MLQRISIVWGPGGKWEGGGGGGAVFVVKKNAKLF